MEINQYIDHTNLRPEAVVDDILRLCQEAAEHRFAAVCVNPCYVDLCAHLLKGTGIQVATVIGFPLGATTTAVKVAETKEALLRKADEFDMVIHVGAAKSAQWEYVCDEIRQVVAAAEGRVVKVIAETSLLVPEEKRQVCLAAMQAGAHFIKTSTGFGGAGATEEDIKLFKAVVGDALGIKASGGIKTREQAIAMLAAGAVRIGTSNGVALVK